MSNQQYINLRAHSDYSLGMGVIKVKELVKYCANEEIPAVALCDYNNMFASLEFSQEASKNGIQPIVGVVFDVLDDGICNKVVIIASNQQGYSNILRLSSDAYLNRTNAGAICINKELLFKFNNGLICLNGGLDSKSKRCFDENRNSEALAILDEYQQVFGDRLYIEINRYKNQSFVDYENLILDYAYSKNIAIVASNPTFFLTPELHEAQDVMMCIANGRYFVEDERPKANVEHYFKSNAQMQELFFDLPEALENTLLIAQRCSAMSVGHDPMLPRYGDDINVSEEDELANQARVGLNSRIEHITDENKRQEYLQRLEFELSVINKMKYAGYFLIVSDFIRWSKINGIPVGPGRGSGAGSVVAWSVQITDLDPLRFGLLFERFLNPERVSMPDFDIDFCQDRREEVIEYVRSKYGEERVSQIITFGKLQARAVLRDVGRVLHLPYVVVDRICKMVPNNPANPVTLKQAIDLDKELRKTAENDPEIDKLLKISLQLEGINRHVSTHAAGVIIADRPIVELIPLYQDDNSSMPAVQYSMKYAEAAGLVKFDFLGLKTLTVISWACNLINSFGGNIDISKIPLDDKKTYELLSRGETVGVFQFESSGMREAIKKLKPDCVDDLIALGSLYRPGPMDNIPSYINRKHGLEVPEYLHPLMEPILKETYGIIVYQEQVMEIAKVLGGYTLGGADLLRRAMGKKIKAEMDAQREIFVNGCVNNAIAKNLAEEIFALMEKFASYGFNKSHAAAYAIISYQTAYLKANYPLEFLVASMNLEIHDTDKINVFCQEAKRMGIEVRTPNVNKSFADFIIEDDAIRFALGALKNVGIKSVDELSKERKKNGDFKSLADFLSRAGERTINKRMVENLAKSGAFDCVYQNRRELFENSELLTRYAAQAYHEKNNKQIGLFGALDDDNSVNGPSLLSFEPWTYHGELEAEFEALGFYLSKHPLESYAAKLSKLHVVPSNEIEKRASLKGSKISIVGVITSKKIRSSQRGKYAFLQLSDQYGLIEASIFKEDILYKNEAMLEVGKIICVKADARKDDTGLRVIVESISDIDTMVANVQTRVNLIISDKNVIPLVKSVIVSQGNPLSISLKLPTGELVAFNNNSKLFIDQVGMEQLRKVSGLELLEL